MQMRFRRTVPTMLTVAATGLGLAACGESTIGASKVEDTITKQFAAQGVQLTGVQCGDGVEAEVGGALSCTGVNSFGSTLELEGKVTAIEDDKASFQVRAVSGVAKGPRIAAQALELIERKVGEKQRGLTCPENIPLPTKPSVTCELETQDNKRFDTTVKIGTDSRMNVQVADTPKS